MKRFLTFLTSLLLTAVGSMPLHAQPEELNGKLISLGSTVSTLQTGKWYVLYNAATTSYAFEGDANTLGLATTSPNGTDAAANAGYLVQLEDAGTEGKYYLKSGLGNYYRSVSTSKNNGTEATTRATSIYTIATFTSAGHWSLRSNDLYYLLSSGGKLYGSSSKGSVGGDRDWAFREVSLSSVDDLTGREYVRYILGSDNIVRLTSRRNQGVRLSDNGTSAEGAGAKDNSLSQVWILRKSGDGYTLRNGNTGRYLTETDDFRTPSATAVTIHIQMSPNNTGDQAYVNICEKSNFVGKVCLNLGTDGMTLHKWTCEGDAGCDWSLELVKNFTMKEVEDHLLAQSDYKEPAVGKYYRLKNVTKMSYMNENFSTNGLVCEGQNPDKLSQYWTLTQDASGKWLIQNLCTQRYIAKMNGTMSTQYRTVNTKPTAGFEVVRTDDATSLVYYIKDTNSVGLHCDGSSNVVGWNYNNVNNVWGFEEVELTEDFIAAGRQQLADYTTLQKNLNTYKAALQNLFEDNACTVLKPEVQALSDAELAGNADFAALNADMQAMVLKVKNNTWQSFTSSTGYTREGFEKFFRVRDDFLPYSHYQKMAWNEYAGMSNAFGKLSGPTGIVGKTGDIIYIYLEEEPSADCTLQAEVVQDSETPGDRMTGVTTNLHAGLNTILLSNPSTLYIFYQLDDPTKYLADYPAAKIHIEGGQLQGYFDLTRGMTNQDWRLLSEKMMDKSTTMNLKCDRLVFVMLADLVRNATAPDGEMEGLMRVWNNFIECEENLMGFKEDLKGRFRNIWCASSVNHGYMYATTYGTYYSDGTIETVMNYERLTNSGGAIWGPSHEIGHNHQSCLNIVGATEVSNNLFSNTNVFYLGVSTTRGTTTTATLDDFARGQGWFGMSIWEQTRFYYQLFLYFHAQGHNPEFYPRLFKLLRQDPIKKRSNVYDANVVNDKGEKGGYLSYGKDDYLHMAKKMCDAAQLDLSELFEVNGMFVPYDKIYIGDYSDYWVVTTQQDIDEAKAYMHRYPKAPSICFIDDRIKPSPAIFDGPLEGRPDGEFRRGYDDGEVPIGYADVGQWSDFVDAYQCNGYYYTSTYSQGLTTYTMNGTGAVGYKVYDTKGNLVFLSNRNKFTIPAYVAEKLTDGLRIVACEGNGYEVEVPYGPALYRGEMTVYYEGQPEPHTLHYYGTGTAAKSSMSPLPANSIAYIKPGQTAKKLPTAELLANANVVNNGVAQTLVIDGNKPFYAPTEFTAASLLFTKDGEGYQALSLPFDTQAGLGIIDEEGSLAPAETQKAGQAVVFNGKVSIAQENTAVAAGTFAETDHGCILGTDGASFVKAEGISPFTYVWDESTGINDVKPSLNGTDAAVKGIFNMAGQRVSQPTRGLYIIDGRKVMVK